MKLNDCKDGERVKAFDTFEQRWVEGVVCSNEYLKDKYIETDEGIMYEFELGKTVIKC